MVNATLAVLFVSAIRLVRPIITIRVGQLPGQFIGNLAPIPEIYLCERDAKSNNGRILDIFFFYEGKSGICNRQLKKMWQRRLIVSPFRLATEKALRRLPERHRVPWRDDNPELDKFGLLSRTEPHLSFTDEEEMKGKQGLKQLGIPDDKPFVCMHARDRAFTNSTQLDWNRYESEYRNCKAENMVAAGKAIAKRGHFALRMGSLVESPISNKEPGLIDYATFGTNDFMDIYLSAKCSFFIGCTSGLFMVAQIFRRPIVLTNYARLADILWYGPDTLIIPKKAWLKSESRFLTFPEMVKSGAWEFLHTQDFENIGVELIENTPEEITAVSLEMMARLDGSWQTTEEDEELQEQFWSSFDGCDKVPGVGSRIGAKFLRENDFLLNR